MAFSFFKMEVRVNCADTPFASGGLQGDLRRSAEPFLSAGRLLGQPDFLRWHRHRKKSVLSLSSLVGGCENIAY